MKTLTLSVLLLLIAGITSAQFEKFDAYKVQTFASKSKVGNKTNQVNFLDNVEFQRVQKRFNKKSFKKLGETVINPANLGKEYICTPKEGNDFDRVCFRVFEVDDEKKLVKLEFRVVNNQTKSTGKVSEFYYQIKKEYNYVVSLNTSKKNCYTFLISPSQSDELAEK